MAGVPVSLPTPGADAKLGPGKILKGPEDATAALLLGLAEGQSERWLPSPTLTDTVQFQGVLTFGGPQQSAWEEDFEEDGGEQCIAQSLCSAFQPSKFLGFLKCWVTGSWKTPASQTGNFHLLQSFLNRLGDLHRKIPETLGSWCLYHHSDTM